MTFELESNHAGYKDGLKKAQSEGNQKLYLIQLAWGWCKISSATACGLLNMSALIIRKILHSWSE